jgi:hypothetical protein
VTATSTSASGETRAPRPEGQTTAEDLARIAHAVLDNCGLDMSRSKVSRLIRTFQARVAGNGWSFFDFLANSIQLDAEHRRQLLHTPDVARVISYADPTGETAVRNVLRHR